MRPLDLIAYCYILKAPFRRSPYIVIALHDRSGHAAVGIHPAIKPQTPRDPTALYEESALLLFAPRAMRTHLFTKAVQGRLATNESASLL